MPNLTLTVRALQSSREVRAFYRISADAFGQTADPAAVADRWRRFAETSPSFDPSGLRGVFEDGELIGGCRVFTRGLRLGTATLPTGCVAGVFTHPAHRGKGVARTLMRDVFDYARDRRYPLLLLDGIPHFYHRFGFVDVFDWTRHLIQRTDIPSHVPDDCRVREATAADAPAILELYSRHYATYSGSSKRMLAEQEHRLEHQDVAGRVVIAEEHGRAAGYLLLSRNAPHHAYEAAADSWPAAKALLRYQDRAAPDPESDTLKWEMPPDSPTFFHLIDHLPLRTETLRQPSADWMAAAVDAPALVRAALPELERRWAASRHQWRGTLELVIDQDVILLQLDEGQIRVRDGSEAGDLSARLTSHALLQMLFSYRTAASVRNLPGTQVPAEALHVLQTLFPRQPFWIPGSDAF